MVPNVPFWLSQANTEFGGGGAASTILSKAGIPAPRWLSNLAGKSSATHQLTIGSSGAWAGKGSGFGAISPATVAGFTITDLNYDGSSWRFYLGGSVSDERITVEIPGVASVMFEFLYSSQGDPIGGDVHGVGQYIKARVGQTIGVNLIVS